ncbi:helix-turn-helix transcriptional regulator [Streptomyces fulvoviolaceus]|uniref:helix-turn-helix transcriptional regulator n=1 Tax=Streptomyces fulvoviolaceus TaxID=285535 RepID=UPI000693E963|nr:helix-turn-helix transcriptional regulator [Streptomyces fulvoviolaceus]MCT9083825.1 helix-turn-helix transcriptional regulator [Streptomyces fulvoviolaceus]
MTTHVSRTGPAAEAGTADELGALLSTLVGRSVPHDGYLLAGMDPVSDTYAFHTARRAYGRETMRLLEREFGTPREALPFCRLFHGPTPVGVLRADVRAHRRSGRLDAMLRNDGLGTEMRIALPMDGRAWGGLVLTRERGSRAFSDAEAGRAERLVGPLAVALRRYVVSKPLRVAPYEGPPGVVVLGPDGTVKATTPGHREWLREYVPDPTRGMDDTALFDGLWDLTYTARVAPGGTAVSRLYTSCGWRTLHVQPLTPHEGADSVVTLQPATADELLPALTVWYGITPREREVLRHALDGLPAKSIARRLELSLHTVNDHLRAVYRKLGVGGRDELSASLRPRGNP